MSSRIKKLRIKDILEEEYEDDIEYTDDIQEFDLEDDYIFEEEYPEDIFDISEEPSYCTPEEVSQGVCFDQYYTGGGEDEDYSEISLVRDQQLSNNPKVWEPIAPLNVGPVVNQSPTPSCWANSFCSLWYSEMRKRDPHCEFPSPLWLLANRFVGCGSKGTTHEAFRLANKIGMLPFGMFPLDKRNPITPMDKQVCDSLSKYDRTKNKLHYEFAQRFATKLPKVTINSLFNNQQSCSVQRAGINQDGPGSKPKNEYDDTGNVGCVTDKIKKAQLIYNSLLEGFPVMLLIVMNSELGQTRGAQPVIKLPLRSEGKVGFHFVVACGFDIINGEPCFKIKNSWATTSFDKNSKLYYTPWGDNGYFWLSLRTADSWMQAVNFKNTQFVRDPYRFTTVKNLNDMVLISEGGPTPEPTKPLYEEEPKPVVAQSKPNKDQEKPTSVNTLSCDNCVTKCVKMFKGRYSEEQCKKLACKKSCTTTKDVKCGACSGGVKQSSNVKNMASSYKSSISTSSNVYKIPTEIKIEPTRFKKSR